MYICIYHYIYKYIPLSSEHNSKPRFSLRVQSSELRVLLIWQTKCLSNAHSLRFRVQSSELRVLVFDRQNACQMLIAKLQVQSLELVHWRFDRQFVCQIIRMKLISFDRHFVCQRAGAKKRCVGAWQAFCLSMRHFRLLC